MSVPSPSQLSDQEIRHRSKVLEARGRVNLASLLTRLAEIEDQNLHLTAGYSTVLVWCEGELQLDETEATEHLEAARVARRFPAILRMIARGQLDLATVLRLAPRLTPANADALLAEAAPKQDDAREADDSVVTIRRLPDGRAVLDMRLSERLHDKLCYAQALLGDEVPAGDLEVVLEAVLKRALEALIDSAE